MAVGLAAEKPERPNGSSGFLRYSGTNFKFPDKMVVVCFYTMSLRIAAGSSTKKLRKES